MSFYFQSERGLFPQTEFVYDLELPETFEPRNTDGEVGVVLVDLFICWICFRRFYFCPICFGRFVILLDLF